MKKSIKTAVWLRVIVIFVALVLSAVFTITGLLNIRSSSLSSKTANEIHVIALSAEKAHLNWIENLSSSISFGTEFTGSTDYTSCSLGNWLYHTDRTALPDPRIDAIMNEIEPIHQRIHSSASEILGCKDTDHARAQDIYLNQTKADVNTLLGKLEEVIAIINEVVVDDARLLQNAELQTITVFVISMLMIFIVCILLIRYIMHSVVSPITIITDSNQKLAKGELNFQIDIHSENEIGVLADSLNSSVKTLSTYVEDISDTLTEISEGDLTRENNLHYIGDFVRIEQSIKIILDQLNDMVSRLAATSEEVSRGAEQVASGAQSLAQGSTEQTTEIEKLLERVHLVSGQIGESVQSARDTNSAVAAMGGQIDVCSQTMKDMSGAMQEISSNSKEIGNIIKAIEDIAFQTNILALNAAVEAARAGTAGKGFAVVADEVRNLAAKSAEAAQSTTALIEKSLKAVSRGVDLTGSTQDSLDAVINDARIVTDRVREISDASAAQEMSVSDISVGLAQISQVVQTNSATSEESAAASEELFGQAQIVKNLVGQFKIKTAIVSAGHRAEF